MLRIRALFLLIAWTIALGASGAPLNPSQDQWTQPTAHLRVPSFNHIDEDICNLDCNQGQGACKYTPNNKWIQCSAEGSSGECPAHTTKCEPPSPDTLYDEGHDLLLLESQFNKMHPGALTPASGCCNGVASFPATKTSWSECVEWFINANADFNIQNDIEACQFDSSMRFQTNNCMPCFLHRRWVEGKNHFMRPKNAMRKSDPKRRNTTGPRARQYAMDRQHCVLRNRASL